MRQTIGIGSKIFTIPARMMGTEQKTVTRTVNTILSKIVIAASILVIILFFKKLAIDKARKPRKWPILTENGANDGS
ncbi:hypothetical protein Ef18B233LT_39500 [Escherichia fergusonii]|nr:hypothetical protein Ef30038_03100 [Escherichia fergusonii]BES10960.1 hypothetical protein Ef18B006LT_40550 [Escherichia fergusonii]BES11614.1 hypothetical protein Ef18B226LT_01930 [Escherichia fergusonii]BES20120.1 hypothetical protein Ef18B233LT_39500 [Escherichia fergusonii]BES24660.1 hypothetical protein Ef18B269LT_40040 [Escherichia fergusonii]